MGKTYIAKRFGENEYQTCLLIDFSNAPKAVKEFFELNLEDLDTFFNKLQLFYKIKLVPRKSLIIFDEVQSFPLARQAIKYLVADGRFDYIETGYMVSDRGNVKDILIPSEEERFPLYPMDFEEFLWAQGEEQLLEYIHDRFSSKKPMGGFHRRALDLFRQFLIAGGMPQAVDSFVKHHDFSEVDGIKREIIDLYRNDIQKYARCRSKRALDVFDGIAAALQAREKKLVFSNLRPNARMRDYEAALTWLEDAGLINCCSRSASPNIGLRLNEDRTSLKCYFLDTGLLTSLAFDEKNALHQKILFERLDLDHGMLVQNYTAQQLRVNRHRLYFYSSYSRAAAERMDIDFLVAKSRPTSGHKICPIEVKSGKNLSLVSLMKFRKKFSSYLSEAYVLYDKDVEIKDGIIFLPLYMTMCL